MCGQALGAEVEPRDAVAGVKARGHPSVGRVTACVS